MTNLEQEIADAIIQYARSNAYKNKKRAELSDSGLPDLEGVVEDLSEGLAGFAADIASMAPAIEGYIDYKISQHIDDFHEP